MHHKLTIWLAFLRRDFLIALSYKISFINTIFVIFLNALVFFYFSKIVDVNENPYLTTSSYYSFVIIGIAISDFTFLLINKISQELRNYQLTGVMDSILISPGGILQLLLPSYAYPFILGTVRISIYLFFGQFIFGATLFTFSNIDILVLTLILTTISLVGIGLISGAYTVLFKQGNPIAYAYMMIASIIGGIFIPQGVYPEPVILLSKLLPITHTLDILRELYSGTIIIVDVLDSLLWLGLLGLTFLIIGIISIRSSYKIAQKTGSLYFY